MQKSKRTFCKVWFNACEECDRKFAAQRVTQSLCPIHAKHAAVNPVAYTRLNERVAILRPVEANILIGHNLAEWRGRKEGIAVTLLVPAKVALGVIGAWRQRNQCDPRALDSKTHSYTGPKTWKHTRNGHYYGGVSRLINVTERAA
jgi:hypothetical protein